MIHAKRPPVDGGSPKCLEDHSSDVLEADLALFGGRDGPSQLGECWLRFFKLTPEVWPGFLANRAACALLHDIGKANTGFQRAMTGRAEPQPLRHEHLSAMILALPAMQAWLAANPLLHPGYIVSAVAGHHLKATRRAPRHAGYPAFGAPWGEGNLIAIAEPETLATYLRQVAEHLSLPAPPPIPTIWTFDGSRGQDIEEARTRVERLFRTLERTARDGGDPLLPALKAALIAADGAGSGLPREGLDVRAWIGEQFDGQPLTPNDIEQAVLAPRISQIEQARRRSDPGYRFAYQDFQRDAASLPARTLLLAGCGSGKTLAAWRWIGAQLRARPARRAIFLYPTRATATEGFKDYVSHAPEDATLLSGTARYELPRMFDNPEDPRSGRNYETESRLFAIGRWSKRYFSATVDQFLGFMQQDYQGTCLLPVLADSVVVIDEVHSFDPGLFATLLRFLRAFDLPVLCMTASLPASRRRALQDLDFSLYPSDPSQFEDLEARSRSPRYRVQHTADAESALEIAKSALGQCQRVLWVVNTVDRCQELARILEPFQPASYHSRFKLEDRNRRHREVVERFAGSAEGPLIAITTQVCEMSLDLDADVLISELAPIPALIQRMGRCHRHQRTGRPLGEVYVYSNQDCKPYDQDDLAVSEAFLADLIERPSVCQADLEERLEHYTSRDASEPERLAAFLDDGPWARGGAIDLRDANDFTHPAILDSDLEQGRWRPGEDGLVLPVPKWLGRYDSRLPGYLRLAPASHYCPRLGFHRHPIYPTQGATE